MTWRSSRFPARRAVLRAAPFALLAAAAPQARAAGAIGGPFALEDPHGRIVTDRDLRGHYTLVYFGYTRCGDLCPVTLAKLARVLAILHRNAQRIQAVFISVDPAHDTPAIMGAYTRQFSPHILPLTGSQTAITQAITGYHVFVGKGDLDTGGIKHSSLVFLMGPDGKFRRTFSGNQSPEAIAKALAALPLTG